MVILSRGEVRLLPPGQEMLPISIFPIAYKSLGFLEI